VTALDPTTGRIWWREEIRTPGDQAVSTPVFSNLRLLIAGLMLKLDADKPAATVLWPEPRAVSKRILSNSSTALLRGEHVFSARTSGELVCLEAVFLFTDRGDLIRAQLTPKGYREIGRAHLLEPTSPFGDRKCAWTPPAYANRHVFARNDEELVCASLAAKP